MRCEKCGCDSITTRFVKVGQKLFKGFTEMPEYAEKEHLNRTCTKCGYSWTTPTLDSVEAP